MGSPLRRVPWMSGLALFLLAGVVLAFQTAQERSERRAFYTAPPVVPHELDGIVNEDCLMCHEDAVDTGDGISTPTPHPDFSNSLQCHVGTAPPDFLEGKKTENKWSGLAEPTRANRAHELSPPVIPHRLFLRDNCLSCHHPEHPNEMMRTPHPDRSNCQQCHVSVRERQF